MACSKPARDVRTEINIFDISKYSKLDLIAQLQEWSALAKNLNCPKCDQEMQLTPCSSSIDAFVWTCRAKVPTPAKKKKGIAQRCNYTCSLRANTFFARSHLTLHQIVIFANLWMDNTTLEFIEKQLRIYHQTAVNWSNFCREVVYDAMITRSEPIGGIGKTVEIDESKFGKRKYYRGHRVDGVWVFGGIERDTGRIFMVPVERRDANTLIPLIEKWILKGTTIISDHWKAYDHLDELGYTHLKVNHSINFVDEQTGAHSNGVESSWRHAKVSLQPYRRRKASFGGYLAKYMFLKTIRYAGLDPTIAFFQAAGSLYNGKESKSDENVEAVDLDDVDDDDFMLPLDIEN